MTPPGSVYDAAASGGGRAAGAEGAPAPAHRLIAIGPEAPPELLALSPVIAEAVAQSVGAGEAPPTVVIRRQAPYALLGPKDRRLPRLQAGVDVLRRAGLPVYERIAGGTVVILDEGCLSFAVSEPCRDFTAVHRNFDRLTEGVRRGLRRLGVEAEFGEAPGSFCPGPYDLLAGGRKIAGIAQAMRRGFAMVSGMLIVSQDPVYVTNLLNEFYAAAGGTPDLVPDHVVTLSDLVGRRLGLDEVEDALKAGFAEVHPYVPALPTEAELERARRLAAERRLA